MSIQNIEFFERPRSRSRSPRFRNRRDRSYERHGGGSSSKKHSKYRALVSNLPYEYRWSDLKDLFRHKCGEVSFAEIFVDDRNRSTGIGFVQFDSQRALDKALDIMQLYELQGRKIILKDDTGIERDKKGRVIESKSFSGGHSGNFSNQSVNWDTYGLSPHFLESLHITGPLTNKVFVANLDYKIDEKKLREVFQLAGKVQGIEILKDKDGSSRGFAVIEYEHPVESVQAISMLNNQYLFDRQMTVRMDKSLDNNSPVLPEGLRNIGMGLGNNGAPLKNVACNIIANMGQLNQTPQNNYPSTNISSAAGIIGNISTPNLPGMNLNTNANLNQPSFNQLQQAAFQNLTGNLLSNSFSNLTNSGLSQSLLNSNMNTQFGSQSTNLNSSQSSGNIMGKSHFMGPGDSSNYSDKKMDSMIHNHSIGGNDRATYRGNDNSSYRGNDNLSYKGNDNNSSLDIILSQTRKSNNNYNERGDYDQRMLNENIDFRSSNQSQFSDTIVVTNLPPSAATRQLLYNKFKDFGDVTFCEMRGIDSGVIRFQDSNEASKAVDIMNGARVDGRIINVRIY